MRTSTTTIDGDGLPDLFSSDLFAPYVFDVQLNRSTPGRLQWGDPIQVTGVPGPLQGVEDLDGDGRGDLLLTLSPSGLGVIRNPYLPGMVGACDLGPATVVAAGTDPWRGPALAFADLDLDGRKECVNYFGNSSVLRIIPNQTVREPEVWLQIPARAQRQIVGATVTAQAFAFHIPGTIDRVEFFEGTNLLATTTGSRATAQLTLARAGLLEIRAEVVNSLGERFVSEMVRVSVVEELNRPLVPALLGAQADAGSSYVIDTHGELYAGGRNDQGQLGLGHTNDLSTPTLIPPPEGVAGWTSIAAAAHHSAGVAASGELYVWGHSAAGSLVEGYTNAVPTPTRVPRPAGVNRWISVCSLDLFCPGITNLLPTVAILSPPTGTKLYSPVDCEILIEAADLDGFVDEVELFVVRQVQLTVETNRVARLTSSPYRLLLTNLTSSVTLFARVTDNSGARVVTAMRSLTIYSSPSLSYVPLPTNAVPNPFTGFIEQRVTFQNASTLPVAGLRLLVANLTNGVALANCFGETNGTPYVEHAFAVAPGERVTFTLEYRVPPGQPLPSPRFSASLVTPESTGTLTGELAGLSLWLIPPGGGYGLEFPTLAGVRYAVQYSADLSNWRTSEPVTTGDGGCIRWLDQGPPRTSRPPGAEAQRFYRVLQLP